MRVPSIVVSLLLVLALASLVRAPGALASHEAVVYLTAAGFSPASVALGAGDRVRFTVRDHRAHQLAKTSGPNSGDVAPNVLERQGHSITLMPVEPGTYTYVDRLNPKKPEFRLTLRR
ncbi:MAG TPA: cupredoxin domain-containing protein [Candidatus Elarobacter sp.]|jgi:plastocyanin